MNVRTPVFVYADDPVSQAGLEQLLRCRAEILVVGIRSIDAAEVAVIGTDEVDDDTVRTIAGVQRDGCPRVVRRRDAARRGRRARGERGRHARHAAAPRRDAGAPGRVVQQVAAGEASVPTDLVGAAARRGAPAAAGRRRWRVRRAGDAVDREQDVIRLLADGRDTAEIASTLCYSERTVKGVIHEVTTRLQLRNRSHVVAFALRNDMI